MAHNDTMAAKNRPQMCPSCRKLMGVADICPYCGANARALTGRFKRAANTVAAARGGEHAPHVTYILTVLIVGIFFATLMAGGQEEGRGGMDFLPPNTDFLARLGLMSNHAVLHGEPWRLVTAIFLHLSLLHVLFNAMAIWVLGRHYEADVGGPAMLATFIVAGVGGFLLGLVLGTAGGGGASGAGTGLMGAIIVRRWRVDGNFRSPVTQYAIQFAISTAIFGLAVPRVNNVAHLGGFLVGGLVGWVHAAIERKTWAAGFWLAAGWTSGAVALASALAVALVEPGPNGGDALAANRCVVMAIDAVTADQHSVSIGAAGAAIECLDRLPKFDGDGQAALVRLRAGIVQSRNGRQGGRQADERAGVDEIFLGERAWGTWLHQNLDRFGLEVRDH